MLLLSLCAKVCMWHMEASFSARYNEVRKRFLLYLPCFEMFLMTICF